MGASQIDHHSVEVYRGKNIVFYDGTCGLCHGSVQWLLRRKNGHLFMFATQQGPYFKTLTQSEASLDAIVYFRAGQSHEDAEALAYICKDLGHLWGAFYYLWKILPTTWSKALYFVVAKRRYGIFGRAEYCELPTPEKRKQFLP
jgi:predicted DCC family thiol-disulfide oxidoreductase YuxK